MRCKRLLSGIIVTVLAYACGASRAEEIRDYYAEPGLQPVGIPDDQGFGDTIDPFSGTLQLNYTDIVVPGPGDMDVMVNRSYVSPKGVAGPHRGFGIGWTLHFGRIVVPTAHATKICTQNLWSTTTADNPSLELPDGRRELLVLDSSTPNYRLITKSNWIAECPADLTDGMRVHSPNGRTYEMNVRDTAHGEVTWYTSSIQDLDGNRITISYGTNPTGITYIQNVTRTDQASPILVFAYDDLLTSDIRIKSITVKGGSVSDQVWQYSYVTTDLANHFQLAAVTRPDGLSWLYEYFPFAGPTHESLALRKITHPNGGVIQYTYDKVFFGDLAQPETPVVKTKSISGRSINSGTWTYDYAPGGAKLGKLDIDRTTVTTPAAKIQYDYYGYKGLVHTVDSLWLIGLLIEQRTYSLGSSTPLETIQQQWRNRVISEENYWHGRGASEYDNQVFAPLNAQTGVYRGTWHYTYNDTFDQYGNALTIRETSPIVITAIGSTGYAVPPERKRTVTYYNDVSNGKWVIGKPQRELTSWVRDADNGLGPTTESTDLQHQYFTGSARVSATIHDGVRTEYTYTSAGDLQNETDPLGYVTTYDNYRYGIPQLEIHPVASTGAAANFTITRAVNNTGTVASITDGRKNTKTFTYDSLNRLQGISYPKAGSAPVSMSHSSSTRTLTRGNLKQTDTLDGFGRIVSTLREDTSDATKRITQNFFFDALGRLLYASNPNPLTALDADRFTYDALSRRLRHIHADLTSKVWSYIDGSTVREVNERGFAKVYSSVAYGHPDHVLSKIEIDEQKDSTSPQTTTVIWPNLHGLPTRILQGPLNNGSVNGPIRSFEYDSRYYLTREVHPEVAVIDYVTDANGNVREKWWGGLNTGKKVAMSYDRQNRLTSITYPTMDSAAYAGDNDLNPANVAYTYDAASDLTRVDKGGKISWLYTYDTNNNLLTEQLTIPAHNLGLSTAFEYASGNATQKRNYSIQARIMSFDYTYDALDHLTSMRYPSKLLLNYAPDALGRPTTVRDATAGTEFASKITYDGTGLLKQITLGNGLTTVQNLTPRRQILSIQTGNTAGKVLDLTYTYDATGNVDLIADPVGDMDIDTTFDGLDQLISAAGPWGTINYRYTPSGELEQRIGPLGKTFNYFHVNGSMLDHISSGTGDFPYVSDLLGNFTIQHTFTVHPNFLSHPPLFRDTNYDGSSNLVFVGNRRIGSTAPTVDKQFVYDGSNHRTLEVTTDTNQRDGYRYKYTAYGKGGELMYEDLVEDICPVTRDYIRLGSVLLAQKENRPDTDTDLDGRSDCFEKENGLDPLKDDATVDSDGDGLSNLVEWQNGLDRNNSDTDGDGLDDAYEFANRDKGLDPKKFDSDADFDHDGVPTLVEKRLGTNPFAADSDGDGMSDGYELHNQGLNPNANDASADLDLDGATNASEYSAGSWASRATSTPANMPTQVGGEEWRAIVPPTCLPVGQLFGSRFTVASWGQLARLSKGHCPAPSQEEVWLELRRADGNFFKVVRLNYGTTATLASYRLNAPTFLSNSRIVVADSRYVSIFDPDGTKIAGDYEFGSDNNYITGPAAVMPDRGIVVATDNGTIITADLQSEQRAQYSLRIRWQENIGATIVTAPLVTSIGKIVVGTSAAELVVLNAIGNVLSRRTLSGTLFRDSLSRGPDGAVIVAAQGAGYRKFSDAALSDSTLAPAWTFNVAATSQVSQALVDANEQYFVTESTNGSIARFITLNSAGVQVADYIEGFLSLGTTTASLRTLTYDGRLYACASKGNAHKCYIFSSLAVAGKLTAEVVLDGRDEIVPIGGNVAQIYDNRNFPSQTQLIRIPPYAPPLSAWPTLGGP